MSDGRRFLLLHGWQNRRPPNHWQWQLADTLRTLGEQVLYPQLPDPDYPSLDAWRALLLAELDQLGNGERVVIAHSAAVVLWLHAAPWVAASRPVDRILLVAPPSLDIIAQHDAIAAFARTPFNRDAACDSAISLRLVCSDNDPYCPEGAQSAYSWLTTDSDPLPGAGHLDPDAGFGKWPSALRWCLAPATRLRADNMGV